jgi:hypothetical protein
VVVKEYGPKDGNMPAAVETAAAAPPRPSLGLSELRVQLVCIALVVALIGLRAYSSITRLHAFWDPDTMNFVDIARNIGRGDGLAQSTLGFNQPRISADDPIPFPLTSQAPGFPLLIALLGLFGMQLTTAALLLSALGTVALLALIYAIALACYPRSAGSIALGVLAVYYPLEYVTIVPFSETVGIALELLALWLLLRARADARWSLRTWPAWMLLGAGLATGLAFATRYVLSAGLLVGLAFVLLESQRKLRDGALFMVGAAAPVALVLLRNLKLLGSLLPSPNASTLGLAEIVRSEFWMLFSGYFRVADKLGPRASSLLLLLLLAGLLGVLAWRGELRVRLRELFFERGRYLLPLWSVVYLLLLTRQRLIFHFDWSPRLLLPASVVLILLLSALVARVLDVRSRQIVYAALALLLVIGLRSEARRFLAAATYDEERFLAHSSKLSWLAQRRAERNLIIGNDTVYVPFFFENFAAISFSPYPYTDHARYGTLLSYVAKHGRGYDHVYVVCDDTTYGRSSREFDYGPFVQDLFAGRITNYPALRRIAAPPGIHVFELTPSL